MVFNLSFGIDFRRRIDNTAKFTNFFPADGKTILKYLKFNLI